LVLPNKLKMNNELFYSYLTLDKKNTKDKLITFIKISSKTNKPETLKLSLAELQAKMDAHGITKDYF